MTRRIDLDWPDARPFIGRGDRPIRILAVSDAHDPVLEQPANRVAITPIDGIIGCGDLEPSWLRFLGDAFCVPIVYVRGNHDRGGAWRHGTSMTPVALDSGRTDRLAGIVIAGLGWPGVDRAGNARHPLLAWSNALGLARRIAVARMTGRSEPILVISHAAPEGVGDAATDSYHRGFAAYRWLLDRVQPPLWLHGHTTTAMVNRLAVQAGPTSVVNVTGAVLVELRRPGPAPD
jgi:Icc-related predicted phosphoesterase